MKLIVITAPLIMHYFLHKSHSTKSDIPNTESVLYHGVAIIEKQNWQRSKIWSFFLWLTLGSLNFTALFFRANRAIISMGLIIGLYIGLTIPMLHLLINSHRVSVLVQLKWNTTECWNKSFGTKWVSFKSTKELFRQSRKLKQINQLLFPLKS